MKTMLATISGHSQNNLALQALASPAGSTKALNIPNTPLEALGFSSAIHPPFYNWIEYQKIIHFTVRCEVHAIRISAGGSIFRAECSASGSQPVRCDDGTLPSE